MKRDADALAVGDTPLPDVVTRLVHGAAFIPKLSKLQSAFSLAMKYSQDDHHDALAKARFRRLADLVWQSCGGSK